jgi:hypothetical protein
MMPTRRTAIKVSAIAIGVLLAGAQAIRPARLNPPIDATRTIEHTVAVPPETAAILDRACADCHSSRTSWPWYAHVAPVSWFVIDHVNHGRRHLNLSDWARFTPAEADHTLGQICEEVSSGAMPLSTYRLMHREARVSPQDVKMICDWTHAARGQPRPPAP